MDAASAHRRVEEHSLGRSATHAHTGMRTYLANTRAPAADANVHSVLDFHPVHDLQYSDIQVLAGYSPRDVSQKTRVTWQRRSPGPTKAPNISLWTLAISRTVLALALRSAAPRVCPTGGLATLGGLLADGNPGLRRASGSRAVVPARDPGAARRPGGRSLPMRQAMTLTFPAWGPF